MPSSEVMHKWKTGKLHSGSKSGPPVTSQAQAIAIMKSEERTEAKHGGHYPEHFQGGVVSKSSGLHDASYAQGGSVLPRSRDFKKEPNEDFLKTSDRFRNDGGKDRDPTPEPTEDVWGKGSSKANPTPAKKTEKPIKPRQ
jgi:hypothetical protein